MGSGKKKREDDDESSELAILKEKRRAARDVKILDTIKWVAVILSTTVPLTVIKSMVEALAGKNTQVTAGLSISLIYGAVATVGWIVTWIDNRGQRSANLELRGQLDQNRKVELIARIEDQTQDQPQEREAGKE